MIYNHLCDALEQRAAIGNKVASVRTCLSQSPYPPFQGGTSGPAGFPSPYGCHCPPTPARHPMMPCSALEGGACEAGGPGPHGGFLLLGMTTSIRHYWRLLPDTIASERHAWREKPNNLKLAQQTKVLIHNQLADKAKARLPTFSHNLHLAIHRILLILSNIHRVTTCRLFESIQFCDVPFFVTHRIICGTSAIPDNRCLTEWISSVKLRLLTDKLFILNNLSVKSHLFTDKLSILSQLFTVIGSWWRAGQPRTAKS